MNITLKNVQYLASLSEEADYDTDLTQLPRVY